jgi:hypothetical protein
MGHSPAAVESNYRARRQREWAAAMVSGVKPDSLTPEEVKPDDYVISRPPKNSERPMGAWVRYGSESVYVLGFASMWTVRAVKIRWLTPKLEWHEAWVWYGAADDRALVHNEHQMPRLGLSVNSPRVF